MRYAPGLALFFASIVAHLPLAAEEEEAVVVFDRVSPSIVGIESVASSGTGSLQYFRVRQFCNGVFDAPFRKGNRF